MQRPSLSDADPAVSRSGVKCFAAGGWQVWCFLTNSFDCFHGLLLLSIYEVKYTTLNPIQLPTTPSAEYALVNINGRNS